MLEKIHRNQEFMYTLNNSGKLDDDNIKDRIFIEKILRYKKKKVLISADKTKNLRKKSKKDVKTEKVKVKKLNLKQSCNSTRSFSSQDHANKKLFYNQNVKIKNFNYKPYILEALIKTSIDRERNEVLRFRKKKPYVLFETTCVK